MIVIRYSGPRGYPGMPEIANVALPKHLLAARRARHGANLRRPDERNLLRHGGLHVAPEAAVGGPLALVRDGDDIVLDVPGSPAWSST